jgi:hypothetical protein
MSNKKPSLIIYYIIHGSKRISKGYFYIKYPFFIVKPEKTGAIDIVGKK